MTSAIPLIIEKFLSNMLKPEPDDVYEVYDLDEEALKE